MVFNKKLFNVYTKTKELTHPDVYGRMVYRVTEMSVAFDVKRVAHSGIKS